MSSTNTTHGAGLEHTPHTAHPHTQALRTRQHMQRVTHAAFKPRPPAPGKTKCGGQACGAMTNAFNVATRANVIHKRERMSTQRLDFSCEASAG